MLSLLRHIKEQPFEDLGERSLLFHDAMLSKYFCTLEKFFTFTGNFHRPTVVKALARGLMHIHCFESRHLYTE